MHLPTPQPETDIKELQEKYPHHLWADKIKGYSICCRRCFTVPPHPSEKCRPPVHYAEFKNYAGYASYCGESIYWDEIENPLDAKKTINIGKVTCRKCLDEMTKDGILKRKNALHYVLEE